MNHEEVLAVLPDSKDEAVYIKELRRWDWRSPLIFTLVIISFAGGFL